MSQVDADRNLLFGVLALQHDLIDVGQFADACAGWAVRKDRPLADLLVERAWISPEDREQVEQWLLRKLKKHGGDVCATLGVVAQADVRDAIRQVEDAEVRKTLSSLPPAAGYVLVETIAPTTEQRLRYTLTRLHAEGGLGKVWVARDNDLNREVALKEIHPGQSAHPEAWRRFLKEAQVTGQLEHPNIVPVYELARRTQDEQPFYTMRFVRGRTLRQAIAEYHAHRGAGKGDPLELPKLLQAFVNICQAIAYAHSRGVIHRDLKPENVVLGGFGEVIVLDWGLAKLVDQPDEAGALSKVEVSEDSPSEATRAGSQLGTPAYMAPEQAEGRLDLIDGRTDIYGLGAILFQILTGRPPHHGKTTVELLDHIVTGETPRARGVEPSVPAALDAICARAMAKSRAERYAKATELAEEVLRWLADEPVTAYPRPWPHRLVRWTRRHRTEVSFGSAALILALVAAAVFARLDRDRRNQDRAYHVKSLELDLQKGLEATAWSPVLIKGMERKLDDLRRLDPAAADSSRTRINQRYARSIGDAIRRAARLEPEDIARIDADLTTLERRAPDLVPALREFLKLRLNQWERVFDLSAPFRQLGAVFDPAQVRVNETALERRRPAGPASDPVLLTRASHRGGIRIEATFNESWSSAPAVGVRLAADGGGNGSEGGGGGGHYEFLLCVPELAANAAGDLSGLTPMARAGGGHLSARILRNGIILSQATIPIPEGPLRLEVDHAGDEAGKFTFRINTLPPLTCDDPFPPGDASPRSLGLYWPAGPRLARLTVDRRALPPEPSGLELGDDLYVQGRFDDALLFFRQQARAASTLEVEQQARYKEALCLIQVGRPSEAAPILEELAGHLAGFPSGSAERWSLRAACRLWALHVEGQQFAAADRLLEALSPRYDFEQLAVLVPTDVRRKIMDSNMSSSGTWTNIAWNPDGNIRHDLRVLRVHELLNENAYERRVLRWGLADDYRIVNDLARARTILGDLLSDPALPADERVAITRDYVWVLIESGDTERALEELDRWLDRDDPRPEFNPLLIERARVLVDRGRWEDAERECEAFFAKVSPDTLDYAEYADACLLRGFLREHRGDLNGAADAWRKGLLRHWPRGLVAPATQGQPLVGIALRNRSMGVIYAVLLISLTGEVTEDEAAALYDAMNAGNLSGATDLLGGAILRFTSKRLFPPAFLKGVILGMCKGPHGREITRQIAFRKTSLRKYIRDPLLLGGAAGIRFGAIDSRTSFDRAEITPEMDELIWRAVLGMLEHYDAKKLPDEQIIKIVMIWSATRFTAPGGLWNQLAPHLDPDVRSSLAYGFGRRYLAQNRPRDAAAFFRAVIDETAPDSLLHRLSAEELNHQKIGNDR